MTNAHKLKDCVVVGGGPAGLSCALFLARHQRRVLVIDQGRPRNYAARAVNGLIGRHAMPPGELLQAARQEAASVGAEFLDGTVDRLVKEDGHFIVRTSLDAIPARRIVLAYGVRDQMPNVPGTEQLYGKGVFHCPTCDGYEIRGTDAVALGNGVKVAGLALELLQWAKRVTVLTNGEKLGLDREEHAKLEANQVQVLTDPVVRLGSTSDWLDFIELAAGRRVEAQALFFTLGTERSCPIAEELGCEIDRDKDVIMVDEDFTTTVRGVYAVGDIVAGSHLVAKAAADGAIAAVALHKSLLPSNRVVSS